MLKIIPNSKLDCNYNYLSDAMDRSGVYTYNANDYKFCSDDRAGCKIKACIDGKCYQDPDGESIKLYKDLSLILSNRFINGKAKDYSGGYKYYHILYNGIEFTSDYIGVSRDWARYGGKQSENQIGMMLKTFRTIGGHMVWPGRTKLVGNERLTINTARGGSCHVYDRFDMTLQAIKCYFNRNLKYNFCNDLFKAVCNEKCWLDEYNANESSRNGFEEFIDDFLLNDFVDDNYNVISLVYDKPIKDDESVRSIFESNNFDKYIQNSIKRISNRSKRICNIYIKD